MKNFKTIAIALAAFGLLIYSCKKQDEPVISHITFEEFALGTDGFWNGSDGSGGFTSGNAFFKNTYDTAYKSWSGFAVSNKTDKTTPGYLNQYSSITGGGAKQSQKYALLYSYSEDTIKFIKPQKISNISFSNSTYAYLAMKNGDNFSKKFGGETGNDPDYFSLTFKAVDDKGVIWTFDQSLYLADFRSSDNSQDYIFQGWIDADLSSVGFIKYLIFSFDSSDKTGEYLNTPTYVCFDNIEGEIL